MKASVLIPVKSLEITKSRLAESLSPVQREKLTLLMLAHVLEIITSVSNDLEIYVVSSDRKILALAKSYKANIFFEKNPGQNQALTDAATQVNPSIPLLTISADLPFLTTEDIQDMFGLIENTNVVLASSKEKTGTNAILMKRPLLIPYIFGENSFAKFQRALGEKHIKFTTYFNETIAFDIDTVSDFNYFKRALHEKYNILQKFYDKVLT